MKSLTRKYMRAGIAAASTCALGGAFYGCSGDDTTANPPTDAGLDVTTNHSVEDSSVVTDAATTDGTVVDSGDGAVASLQQKVTTTLLFSDLADAGALKTDSHLVNPWGLAFSGTGIAWVSDNGTGLATTYTPTSLGPLVVTVPTADGGGTGTPTGQILNATSTNFDGDVFIVATEDGTIQGWQRGPTDAAPPDAFTVRVNSSAASASYKGLAIVPSTPPVLVAADFHNGALVEFDTAYAPIVPDGGGAWTHPALPAGYAPFNIAAIGTQVFVAYAVQDAMKMDATPGVGNGIVSIFGTDGTFVKDLVGVGGSLNAPWGLAMAPAGWGSIGGSLVVGNFGDGLIHSFDATSGALTSTLVTPTGSPVVLGGLWALVFGVNNADAGETSTQLYFTAGPNDESDGLFGFLTPQ